MSLFATATLLAAKVLPMSEEEPKFDDQGYTTHHPILAPTWETIIGSAASLIVFFLLYKYAWPSMKKSFNDRTARIQGELDDSAAAKVAAESESDRIREAKGDIEAERTRLYAEADAQAEALLADGRVRLQAEIAQMEERADAEIAAATSRGTDELRAEIARHSSVAIDAVVNDTLDDSVHQELIEGFIQRVGAGS